MNSTIRNILALVGAATLAVLVAMVGTSALTGRTDLLGNRVTTVQTPAVDYDSPQIIGTGMFKMVSLELDSEGKQTRAGHELLGDAQPLKVTAQGGTIRSWLANGNPSSLIEGRWVSSRSTTWDGQQLTVDTYTQAGTNSNDGTPTETLTIVVSNRTTGLVTIHQEFTSRTGSAKFNYERVGS